MSPALKKALPASFLVYLLPVVGPHLLLPWGVVIVMELVEGLGRRDPAWIAADVALALALQLLAGLLAYWLLRGPGRMRLLAVAPALALLWGVLTWSYLYAIPRFFLIDEDRGPEIVDWPEVCRVEGAYLPDVKTPADLSLEQAGQAFIARLPDSEMALLEMPGCRVADLGVRWSNASPRIHSVAAGGAVLYSLHDNSSDTPTFWVIQGPGRGPVGLSLPLHVDYPQPLLSTDGLWVAWLQRIPAEQQQARPAVLIQSLDQDNELTIDLQPFAPASFRLDHFDYDAAELVLTRSEEEFIAIGFDGTLRWGPWNPANVKAWVGTRREFDGGWVAWDAYREDDRYRLEWSLPRGAGDHVVPRGHGIDSAAVDPQGRYVALVISGRYRFATPDSVYVLRTSDGATVFRRRLPQYSRSRVAFLGPNSLAYTEGSNVLVLELPGHD